MTSDEFIKRCREIIVDYTNEQFDKTDGVQISLDDTFIVWYSKSLQNHKGLFSTNVPDGKYFEMTYNGDKNELYFDCYKKWENKCVKLGV